MQISVVKEKSASIDGIYFIPWLDFFTACHCFCGKGKAEQNPGICG